MSVEKKKQSRKPTTMAAEQTIRRLRSSTR